jgi:hypothetical protein
MVRKAKHPAFEIRENIKVRRLRRQAHGGCCQRRFSIETGASQTCASEKVSDGFQAAVYL